MQLVMRCGTVADDAFYSAKMWGAIAPTVPPSLMVFYVAQIVPSFVVLYLNTSLDCFGKIEEEELQSLPSLFKKYRNVD